MPATANKRLEFRVRNRARRHGCRVRKFAPRLFALITLGNAPILYGRLATLESFLKEGDEQRPS